MTLKKCFGGFHDAMGRLESKRLEFRHVRALQKNDAMLHILHGQLHGRFVPV